jgi:hypothetical protein
MAAAPAGSALRPTNSHSPMLPARGSGLSRGTVLAGAHLPVPARAGCHGPWQPGQRKRPLNREQEQGDGDAVGLALNGNPGIAAGRGGGTALAKLPRAYSPPVKRSRAVLSETQRQAYLNLATSQEPRRAVAPSNAAQQSAEPAAQHASIPSEGMAAGGRSNSTAQTEDASTSQAVSRGDTQSRPASSGDSPKLRGLGGSFLPQRSPTVSTGALSPLGRPRSPLPSFLWDLNSKVTAQLGLKSGGSAESEVAPAGRQAGGHGQAGVALAAAGRPAASQPSQQLDVEGEVTCATAGMICHRISSRAEFLVCPSCTLNMYYFRSPMTRINGWSVACTNGTAR